MSDDSIKLRLSTYCQPKNQHNYLDKIWQSGWHKKIVSLRYLRYDSNANIDMINQLLDWLK